MKKLLPLLFLFFLSGMSIDLEAQINLLNGEEHSVEANINLANDQLSDLKSNGPATLELRNGELLINFPLKENVREEFYKVNLEISLNGVALPLMEENLVGDFGDNVVSKNEGVKNITWMRLVDTYKQLNGKLLVKVKVERWGKPVVPVDCDKPPTFTSKQKRPYYIAGGTGLLAIGAGQLFKAKSEKTYDDDYLTSETLEEATPIYDDANSDHHAYLVLTYAGTAIVAADIIWYLIRNGKHKKRVKQFEKFCTENSLTIRPLIEIPTGTSNNGSTGVHLTFTF